MFSLGVQREFIASHYLIGGDWGKENTEHQHRYGVELVLEAAQLDQHGYLVDIVEVEHHLDEVIAGFRDRTLNALAPFVGLNPSIERLAAELQRQLRERLADQRLVALAVIVREDDIAWTSYRETF
jgi:6-pyruvoyltetrahydropterin/6-carboxytetrahydropterin synthase